MKPNEVKYLSWHFPTVSTGSSIHGMGYQSGNVTLFSAQ